VLFCVCACQLALCCAKYVVLFTVIFGWYVCLLVSDPVACSSCLNVLASLSYHLWGKVVKLLKLIYTCSRSLWIRLFVMCCRFFMFTKPVDVQEVPDYLSIIKQPMDLETMMTKIDLHRYVCAQDFLDDVDLLCRNALEYNPDRFVYMTDTNLTLRRLMSYIYGAPILDVSRSHTTTQHSR